MKNFSRILLILLVCTIPLTTGCNISNSNSDWQTHITPQLQQDIFLFSKLATRLALVEAEMPPTDIELVKSYLIALRDLLAIPGYPDFTGARNLVTIKLPHKYQIYGLTIIDVIERYLLSIDIDITEDQELVIGLITSAINGAIEAVNEFAPLD